MHEGDDTYIGSELADIVFGGPGNDTILTGDGADTVFDGPGDDEIDTGSGDDTIFSTPGSHDIFIDGGGGDLLDFLFADNAITIDLDLGEIQTVDKDLNTIDLDGIFENVTGSVFDGIFTLRPLPDGRTVDGGPGNDKLEDFLKLSENFGKTSQDALEGDMDGDRTVDFDDFLLFGADFGRRTQVPAPEVAKIAPRQSLIAIPSTAPDDDSDDERDGLL